MHESSENFVVVVAVLLQVFEQENLFVFDFTPRLLQARDGDVSEPRCEFHDGVEIADLATFLESWLEPIYVFQPMFNTYMSCVNKSLDRFNSPSDRLAPKDFVNYQIRDLK
jgi:hypothetical protein